jgi:DNA-binding response OmpR family regulator
MFLDMARPGRPSALIIDDSREIRDLEAVVATHCSCDVITADGDHAVSLLRRATPDVLLLGAPVHAGVGETVLDILSREVRSLARRTIVITTHTEDARLLERAASADVYAVIGKPFDVPTLSATIHDCIRDEGASGPVRWIGIPQHILRVLDRPTQ